MRNPKLITLTVGHLPEAYPETLSYWRKQANKLLHRKIISQHTYSSFIVLEIAANLYVHFHVILDNPRYIPQAKISQAWEEISGRPVVDIRKCNPKTVMGYVIKYAVKTPEYESTDDYFAYAKITYKRRLFSATGNLYDVDITKTAIMCPYCFAYEVKFIYSPSLTLHDFLLKHFNTMSCVP